MGKNLIIANSFFEHKDEHKFTREDDTRNERSIIDYILIERQHRKLMKDVKVDRNVELCGGGVPGYQALGRLVSLI